MKVIYKGEEIESEAGSIRELIKTNFEKDFTYALVARLNDKVVDLSHPLVPNACIEPLTFEDVEGKKALWHTTSHVLAYAVRNLYPDAKIAIGPATSEGFYYDFDTEKEFDLEKIEAEVLFVKA